MAASDLLLQANVVGDIDNNRNGDDGDKNGDIMVYHTTFVF